HDSPEGRRLLETIAVPCVTFGADPGADLRAEDIRVSASGVAFRVGALEVGSSLRGWFNVSNCLAALAAARQVGISDDDIVAGIEGGALKGDRPYVVEVDRRAAIRLALASAEPDDVVVIAGKGHETGQEFRDRTIPFDDRTVAREEVVRLLRPTSEPGARR